MGQVGWRTLFSPKKLENVKRMRALEAGDKSAAQAMRIVDYEKVSAVLKQARKLEGTVRNTGLHAAGIIIAPSDLIRHCSGVDLERYEPDYYPV